LLIFIAIHAHRKTATHAGLGKIARAYVQNTVSVTDGSGDIHVIYTASLSILAVGPLM